MTLYIRTVVLASLVGLVVFVAVILTGPDGLTATRFAIAAAAYIATSAGLSWTIGRLSRR